MFAAEKRLQTRRRFWMSSNFVQMWSELGLDLKAHDTNELQELLKRKIFVPEDPQIIGALGCAFLAQSET
jgi:hypothetical protein